MSSSKNQEFEKTSFLSKSNSAFIEQMYLKFINKDKNLPESWFNYFKDPLSIKNQAHESVLIVLEPPKDAISGKYIFNVRVYVGTVQYGNTQKLEVNLK